MRSLQLHNYTVYTKAQLLFQFENQNLCNELRVISCYIERVQRHSDLVWHVISFLLSRLTEWAI